MIKQKVIELEYERQKDFGVFQSISNRIKEYFLDKKITEENLHTFLNDFSMFYENFSILNADEKSKFHNRHDKYFHLTAYKDKNGKHINYLGIKHEPKPTRIQALSYYLQEFLFQLNKQSVEIIQITPIQEKAWGRDGGASFTQGMLVVYKENKR